MFEKSDRKSVHTQAVDALIAQLEKGELPPWRKPWASSLPKNAISKKGYRGLNIFTLLLQQRSSPWWLTYRQAAALGEGCHVLAGEKSTHILFWSTFNAKTKHHDEATGDEYETSRRRGFWRGYSVFNLVQCTPLTAEKLGLVSQEPIEDLPAAEAIWQGYANKPKLEWRASASYRPSEDLIGMPERGRFKVQSEFYSTLFHESAHSTGHASRLNRDGITGKIEFASQEYSFEELVAECASAMLCGQCGIAPTVVENSATYIKHWLEVLKTSDNKQMLGKAISQAQRSVDHILSANFAGNAEELQAAPVEESVEELVAVA